MTFLSTCAAISNGSNISPGTSTTAAFRAKGLRTQKRTKQSRRNNKFEDSFSFSASEPQTTNTPTRTNTRSHATHSPQHQPLKSPDHLMRSPRDCHATCAARRRSIAQTPTRWISQQRCRLLPSHSASIVVTRCKHRHRKSMTHEPTRRRELPNATFTVLSSRRAASHLAPIKAAPFANTRPTSHLPSTHSVTMEQQVAPLAHQLLVKRGGSPHRGPIPRARQVRIISMSDRCRRTNVHADAEDALLANAANVKGAMK